MIWTLFVYTYAFQPDILKLPHPPLDLVGTMAFSDQEMCEIQAEVEKKRPNTFAVCRQEKSK